MLTAGMRRNWRWRRPEEADRLADAARQLAQTLGTHPVVGQLLLNRQIEDEAAARRFLQPKLSDLHEPALVPGVPRAAQRIVRAVCDGQPIVIYGDYDVDGVTASAILWHTLRHAGADVQIYIPHRVDEGYGLNCEAIAQFAQQEDGRRPLLISVDCGITACQPAETARACGLDLIITDHHTFDLDALPGAYALVHPRLPGEDQHAEPYPCGDLCGAGVAFKLAWQVAREICGSERLPESYRDLLVDLLSLVALGTVADVVPLRGENRVLTMFGLGRIKHTRFPGLNAMIDAARLRDEKIDAYHVGFVLGPRLNACGRMGHAKEAARLLTEAEDDEAMALADFLTQENERRRTTERAIVDEARQMILDDGYHSEDHRAIVVGKEGWHPGVIGIVASRLVDQFSRPVVVLNYEDGTAHGSARSVEGVSIHEAFDACAEHLERYGGHAMAAGLALARDQVEAFREALVAYVNRRLGPEDLAGTVEVDGEMALTDCDLAVFEQIHALAPFGRGNPRPALLLKGAVLERSAERMGRGGQHLSLMLRQGERVVRAVAFGMGEEAERLPAGVVVDAVFEPKISTWRGQRRIEVHVQDVRVHEGECNPRG